MAGSKIWRIVGASVVAIIGLVTTVWKWVLLLNAGPLYYAESSRADLREFGLFPGPLCLVVGIGLCFIPSWKQEEEARSRGESRWQYLRHPMPAEYVRVLLWGMGAGTAHLTAIVIWFMLK
jgi:hypothetical protein